MKLNWGYVEIVSRNKWTSIENWKSIFRKREVNGNARPRRFVKIFRSVDRLRGFLFGSVRGEFLLRIHTRLSL